MQSQNNKKDSKSLIPSIIWSILQNPWVNDNFVTRHLRVSKDENENEKKVSDHVPAVARFERDIKSDPEMFDMFRQVFHQASSHPTNKVHNFDSLLSILDKIIVAPPQFRISRDEQGNRLRIPFGIPICLLFNPLSNTSAGYDLFRKPAFNSAMKRLLDSWGQYLTTQDSAKSLWEGEGGWFSKEALQELKADGRGIFEWTYVCPNPCAANRGFTSWDAFFSRKLRPNARPVEAPDDKSVIHNPCESYPHRISHNVNCHDRFWLKGNAYSLYDILDRDEEYVRHFVGGTVYQSFLSSMDYHRWHSPVDGTIKKVMFVPGTYYAAQPDDVVDETDIFKRSQTWLAMTATRALVYIEADNADIGLVCFVAIGLVEVSTCEATVRKGQRVKAGSGLGTFHFGGSSCAVLFGPQVRVDFVEDVVEKRHIKVNSILARVRRAGSMS